MRQQGQIKSWNDERGFGFIRPDQKGSDLFFHVSALPSGAPRPSPGQRVSYLPVQADDGKARATAVTPLDWKPGNHAVSKLTRDRAPHPQPNSAPTSSWSWPRLLVLPVFAAYWGYLALHYGFEPMLLFAYAGMSLLAFLIYLGDKAAALKGNARIPEKTLLTISLCCGWPGALIAQQIFRHKTKKVAFIVEFWLSIIANFVLLYLWHIKAWQRLV